MLHNTCVIMSYSYVLISELSCEINNNNNNNYNKITEEQNNTIKAKHKELNTKITQ